MFKNPHNIAFIKYYFILGSIIIIIFFVIYSNTLLHNVRKELEVFPKIYARFAEVSTKDDIESDLLEIILSEVIQKINFPIIVTDENNEPKYWKNIDNTSLEQPFSSKSEKEEVKNLINKMEKANSYIFLRDPNSGKVISKIFYSESKTMKRLKALPYYEFIILILFIAVGLLGIIIMKRREKEHLWVAMAKETAHQFGTPITSLIGWLHVLKSQVDKEKYTNENLKAISEHMGQDIQRLQNIASRFGKVGSKIKLQESNLEKTIKQTVEYFKPRIPQKNNKINLKYAMKTNQEHFYFDPDLLKWALENLIKNAIDSMKGKNGNITITTYEKNKYFYIRISDEGKGIPTKIQNSVFKTGVTTKARGWGLGLALAKRIIEDFHKGKVYILSSELNKGTVFEIKLRKHKYL